MPLSIKYLRHGVIRTGGARHEEFLFESLGKALAKRNIVHVASFKIPHAIFRGIANLKLFFWGIRESNAQVNIVVGRLALSSLIRNFFNKNKTLVVFHNFDKKDGKSVWLHYYYIILFAWLSKANPGKAAIITVSPYFQKYFSDKFPRLNVFIFPNLFDTEMYATFKQQKRDEKKILLGQFSSKMDESLYELAGKLSNEGYYCYFCTLRDNEAARYDSYEVLKFDFKDYLREMASSYCSLSLSGVNEGWPRMVHESVLTGTPVIGYDKGGLGDLLKQSGSYIVSNQVEAYELIIKTGLTSNTSAEFIKKYDISTADSWIEPITDFIYKA